MLTRANKAIAECFLLAIPAKDAAAMRSVLAPEAHLSLMVAGVYSPRLRAFPQGTQWDRDAIVARELDFQRQLDRPFSLRIVSLVAEGDSVAAEVIGSSCRAATGKPYIQHYSYHFQMSNGRIIDIRLYQDTFHLWRVWSDLEPEAEPGYLTAGRLAGSGAEPNVEALPGTAVTDGIAVNKQLVRRFLTAVRSRDAQITREVWAANGIWSFAVGAEYSPELRAFHGAPRWDREAMIQMQQNTQNNVREPLTLDIYSLIAEEDEVSVEAVGFLVRANGRSYRQHYSFHFKANHGRLVEGHVYQDTLHQYDVTLDHPDEAPVAAPLSPA
jgi:ketosteroid isomerase-like protein